MNEEQLRTHIHCALVRLRREDEYLLKHESSERSIVFRLAFYLATSLKREEYDVDTEYNLRLMENETTIAKTDPEGDLIIPDIVVHRRGVDTHNLIMIEVKKRTNRDESDIEKLKQLCRHYRYTNGLFLRVHTNYRRSQTLAVPTAIVDKGVWLTRQGERVYETPFRMYEIETPRPPRNRLLY